MINIKEYGLGDNVKCISYGSEEEWLALRRNGIGGSDAGAVLKLNKYTSPLKLYRIKKGIISESDSENVFIKKGKDLESLIFEKYVTPDFTAMDFRVVHPEHTFVNKEYPWLQANCDGLAIPNSQIIKASPENSAVIEIKWVSEYAEDNWNGEDYCGIPASYYAQVQHYMTVTGIKVAYVYALFDKTWTVKKYKIPYSFTFCLKLLSETKKFYDNMMAGIEPKITATLDKEFMPDAVHKMPEETTMSVELNSHIAKYLALKEQAAALEDQMNEEFDTCVELYLNGKRPTEAYRMSISTCARSGFNNALFARDYPELYEKYRTVSEYTRTTIKKA